MTKMRGRTSRTGGGSGALDAIDGSVLADGDPSLVAVAPEAKIYLYILDADSGASEADPDVISPDSNAGAKRHALAGLVAAHITARAGMTVHYDKAQLAADHSYIGVTVAGIVGEDVVFGDVLYLKSDGKFWKSDADAEATTAGLTVMATGSVSADAAGVFLERGYIRDDSWAWNVGKELCVSTTPGNPTETKPSDTGDIVRIVGYAHAATIVWFAPDTAYAEV